MAGTLRCRDEGFPPGIAIRLKASGGSWLSWPGLKKGYRGVCQGVKTCQNHHLAMMDHPTCKRLYSQEFIAAFGFQTQWRPNFKALPDWDQSNFQTPRDSFHGTWYTAPSRHSPEEHIVHHAHTNPASNLRISRTSSQEEWKNTMRKRSKCDWINGGAGRDCSLLLVASLLHL